MDAANDAQNKGANCATIQSGSITDGVDVIIKLGKNKWGYNYQARSFNGYFCDASFNVSSCQPWKDIELSMKWNDAWLSNKDCDGDGELDRYDGHDSYRGSGAWLTNHQKGTYMVDGKLCVWFYFVKIVAAPYDATLTDGVWFNADGTEIGPVLWGQFAIIQKIYNDPCYSIGGVQYISLDRAGLGNW